MEDGENCSDLLKTKGYLDLTMNRQLKQSTCPPSSSLLLPANTGVRLELSNKSVTSFLNSCSSTSFSTCRTKVGKFNRRLRTSLLKDATNSGLIDVNDFSNWFSNSSFS